MKTDRPHLSLPGQSGTVSSVHSAIILAGGLGTRLRDVVGDLPKAMAPIHDRPFLEYQLDYWIGQGIRHWILSVGYRREAITEHFGEKYRGVSVEYAVEEVPLGTGGGLCLAVKKLADRRPFLLLNGDTFFEVALAELAEFHDRCRSDWTFSLFRSDEINRYMGVEVNTAGRVLSLQADSSRTDQTVNGGVYLVNPDLFSKSTRKSEAGLSLENDLLPAWHAAGERLFGFISKGRFIDIGLPEDYYRSFDLLESGKTGGRAFLPAPSGRNIN